MTATPTNLCKAVWTVWMQALSQHWSDWPATRQSPTASSVQQDLGAIFNRLHKAKSGPIKDRLIALARQTIPTLEDEWKQVYDEHYPALCTLLSSRFHSITKEQAHDLVQPFASRTIPWMLLKLKLLQEPPIHEEVRYLLREQGITRQALLQILWARREGAQFVLTELQPQLDALAQSMGQCRATLNETIERQVSEWLTQMRTTRHGRTSLIQLASDTLGPLWDTLLANYPQSISSWELFRRLFLDPPIQWRAYLGRCAYHLCQRHLRQQQRQQNIDSSPEQHQQETRSATHDEAEEESCASLMLEQLAEWLQQQIAAELAEQRTKRASVWRRRLWVLYSHWLDGTPKQTLAESFQTTASTITSDCAALALLPMRIHRARLFALFEERASEDQSIQTQRWTQRKELLQLALRPKTPYSMRQLARHMGESLTTIQSDWQQIVDCCTDLMVTS